MTAQIDDLFRYRRSLYSVAGISQEELFDISALGLRPVSTCTACWRGYQAVFGLSKSQLVLAELNVSLFSGVDPEDPWREQDMEPVAGPVINGVSPTPATDEHDWFNNHYKKLHYQLTYSGGLLLAKGFIRDLYVHMGFQSPWKYETVVELIFEAGVIQAEYDRSESMATIRASLRGPDGTLERESCRTEEELFRFIDRAFDRSYGMYL